ncbi:1,2-diacylglycerol 3-alpha-glucosyltransferase [Raineyella antarctica]|uniref:1,2-diacylglycerol 3-alpha-glucosyltransferase n=1 Tax=Raineyella antarctica TaxID=1577474 RepID=A0A1G6GQU1_9ACTN|nr:glycosyltransferase [Raineyella antarctica]SDB83566.1 1,2-diacylglycerol 3-alpha-glucosyltransferase [Raineyella antarctica]
MNETTAEPLRVLLCTDWWGAVNGVVASVTTLKRELIRAGHDVRVLTLADGRSSHHEGDLYGLGSMPASLVYESARFGTLRQDPIQQDILRWAPQVVHSHTEFTTYVWARRLVRELQVPWVHTYHTIYEDYTHYYSPSLTVGKKVAATFSRRMLNRTDAVIAPTLKVSRLLTGYRVTPPIRVVPTGLDLDLFRPARSADERADVQALRKRLHIPEGDRVLVSVSRLAKEKNLEEVLKDFAASRVEAITLVVVGDGPHRSKLQELAAALGISRRVRFAGPVDHTEVPTYYRLGDVYVSASLSETQGLTYIEALACGLPLLCRRDPSLAGVVLDGVTGWQYDDSAGFDAALTRMLADPAQLGQLSRAAATHAERFSARAFGCSVLDVYASTQRRRHLRADRVLVAG